MAGCGGVAAFVPEGIDPEEVALLKSRGRDLYLSESEQEWDMSAVLAAAKKVDISRLLQAEVFLAQAASDARQKLQAFAGKPWKTQRVEYAGITIGIGGTENKVHDESIAIDSGGDTYSGNHPEIQGFSFPSRDTIGLGVLLDLGGHSPYTQGGKDNSILTKGSLGVGLDCDDEPKK